MERGYLVVTNPGIFFSFTPVLVMKQSHYRGRAHYSLITISTCWEGCFSTLHTCRQTAACCLLYTSKKCWERKRARLALQQKQWTSDDVEDHGDDMAGVQSWEWSSASKNWQVNSVRILTMPTITTASHASKSCMGVKISRSNHTLRNHDHLCYSQLINFTTDARVETAMAQSSNRIKLPPQFKCPGNSQ